VKKRSFAKVSNLALANLDTVAIRIPKNLIALELIRKLQAPIAAPSANISGQLSCTTAEDILEKFPDGINGIIVGDQCELGLESTVIDCSENKVSLLRLGSMPIEELGDFLTDNCIEFSNSQAKIKSPGQMLKHYSPDARLFINEKYPSQDDLYLSFGDHPENVEGLNLSVTKNLEEAAKNLFSYLHQLDKISKKLGGKPIKVAPIPNKNLGLAINDRLKRAANSN
jgi:L-threonylcarbamoyladenylate synthase